MFVYYFCEHYTRRKFKSSKKTPGKKNKPVRYRILRYLYLKNNSLTGVINAHVQTITTLNHEEYSPPIVE